MLIWCSVLITVIIWRRCLARCTPCSHLFRFWVYVFVQNLESFPGGGLPSSLNSLETYSCEKLIAGRLGWGLQALPFLRRFCMMSKFEISEYFPERELLPSSLTSLEIWIILFWNLWMVMNFTFIGDWLLPKSSFHARRGSANISMFPECQEMSKTGPR